MSARLTEKKVEDPMSEHRATVVAEDLEPRRFFDVTLVSGIVHVVGTAGDDTVLIYWHRTRTGQLVVEMDGAFSVFAASTVSGFHIDVLGGNDHVEFFETRGSIGRSVTVDGGAGDDLLTGGAEDDQIIGGEGNDYLAGYGGNDDVDGGAGHDSLFGNGGNDVIRGG